MYTIVTVKERRLMDVANDIYVILGVDAEKAIQFIHNMPFNGRRYFVDHEKMRRLGWSQCTLL